MSVTEDRLRSLAFSSSAEPRFWWHRLAGSNYVPPIYSDLTQEEWQIIRDWFAETSRGRELTGECAVPIMSLLQGFVLGSGVRRIVQLGTHSGYSTLLLGFFLRRMRAAHPGVETFSLNHGVRAMERPHMVYKDFCGVGLIQKPV